jgi:outer membrane immunogenic protein
MNKFPAAAGLALALISGSAFAADLPSRKAPPVAVPSAYNWGGLYGGINVGYGFANSSTSTGSLGGTITNGVSAPGLDSPFPISSPLSSTWQNSAMSPSGVIGGGQIGYNYQVTPMFVAGIEADIQASDMGSTVAYTRPSLQPAGGFTSINNAKNIDWFGTARARIGVVVPGYSNFLVYGTGGFAYGYVNNTVGVSSTIAGVNGNISGIDYSIPAAGVSGSSTSGNTQVGWTAGGGVEWSPQTFPAWSAKVEYLYTDLGSTNQAIYSTYAAPYQAVFAGNHQSPTQFNTVRAGLNWHFNPFVGEPIVAKY